MSTNDTFLDTVESLVKGALGRTAVNAVRGNAGSSLAGVAKPQSVEPIVLVDSKLEGASYLEDVLGSLNNLFAGYYLMAAQVIANIDKIEVIRTLDSLNPKRDAWQHAVNIWNKQVEDSNFKISNESLTKRYVSEKFKLPLPDMESEKSGNADLDRAVRESPNLCVGRLLEIKFSAKKSDGTAESFSVHVNLRLLTTYVKTGVLKNLILSGVEDNSVSARFQKFKIGEISFLDLITCKDLVSEHKKLLASDKDGLLSEIYARRRNNAATELLSNSTTFAKISNILIIDESTRKEVEYKYGRSLHDFKAREELIENTGFMFVCVIDREYEKITIYVHTSRSAQVLDLRSLKAKNGKNGPDVSEILKAYQAGSTPSF